jgi:biotin-dependent carboxylase-like uncharacterized protein
VTFEIMDPGALLTVQDLGRPGYEHLGVPRGGAADTRSLAMANRLVGNAAGAAGLEATLLGPRLRAVRNVTIAIAGADLEPVVQPGDRRLEASYPIDLEAGDELEFLETGDPDRGCRAYIAVAGGLDVPIVLGSRSTSLVGAFGGFAGRALRVGDVLDAIDPGATEVSPVAADHEELPSSYRDPAVRVLPGPAADEPGGEDLWLALIGATWTIGLDSDRRGLRLEQAGGARLRAGAAAGDRPSHGVVVGAIQLTPSGQPLVLMPDGGVTGGYPVIAIVVSTDLPLLGQLTPGAAIHFASARVRFGE